MKAQAFDASTIRLHQSHGSPRNPCKESARALGKAQNVITWINAAMCCNQPVMKDHQKCMLQRRKKEKAPPSVSEKRGLYEARISGRRFKQVNRPRPIVGDFY
jgi:hypothetical protein